MRSSDKSSFLSSSIALLAACACAACGTAHGASYCVSTAAALQSALTQSSNGGIHSGEQNIIEIVQGTIFTGAASGNTAFHFYSTSTQTLFVEGGYTPGCASQAHVAALTILDGRHVTGVLSLSNANGAVVVSNLTFQNGESGSPGSGLQVNYLASVNAAVHIDNNIIRNNHSSVDAGGIYVSGAGGETWLFNNLIVNNDADHQYGAGYVTGYGQFNEIIANTVAGNTSGFTGSGAAVGGLFCGGSKFCQIYNNIFWNNTTYGIYLGNSGAILGYNDYGTRGGMPVAQSFDDLSVAPLFVNPAAGNFRLSTTSPLRNYSNEHLSDYDLDGHPYPVTGNVDIGAYQHQ